MRNCFRFVFYTLSLNFKKSLVIFSSFKIAKLKFTETSAIHKLQGSELDDSSRIYMYLLFLFLFLFDEGE